MNEKDEYKKLLEKAMAADKQQSENVASLVKEAAERTKNGEMNLGEGYIVALLGQISQELAGIRRALNKSELGAKPSEGGKA